MATTTNETAMPALSHAETALRSAEAATSLRPRIYYFHPLLAGRLDAWDRHLVRASAAGFSHVLFAPPFLADNLFVVQDFDRPHQSLGGSGDALATLRRIAERCAAHGLRPLLDVMPDHVAAGGATATRRPDLFRTPDPARALDPRGYAPEGGIATARFDDAADAVTAWWAARLLAWREAGMQGFRLASLRAIGPAALRALSGALHLDDPMAILLGWTSGLSAEQASALVGCGLDFVFAPLPGWNFRDERLWTETDRLRRVARVLAPVEAPFGRRLTAGLVDPAQRAAACRRAAWFAAAFADGWMMPMGYEHAATNALDARRDTPADLAAAPDPHVMDAIRAANAWDFPHGPARLVSAPGADFVAMLRRAPAVADVATLVAVNADLHRPARLDLPPLLGGLTGAEDVRRLEPGEIRLVTLRDPPPIILARPKLPRSADEAARAPRIAIENVAPAVDGGRFAAKRVVGDTIRVTADVICDGHDQLAVALLWRGADEPSWCETRMRPLGNDVWAGEFRLDRVGRWLFTVEAWRDGFATYRSELTKKHAAGIDVRLELIEGCEMVAEAARRMPSLAPVVERLAHAARDEQVATLLAADTAASMGKADPRPFAIRRSPPCPVDADRVAAQFASWYEIFPRSMSDDPERHGTFRDVARHLPRIRDMGFDVLYFPPIHPIGRKNRKGRNNAVVAGTDDPGSPYAIGGDAGGHDAIHPDLGTIEDFRELRDAAAAHGLELALDFAIQCAPDHPWLSRHRDWFDWRPDGSLRYAENPPKKYEDIVNVDFYAKAAVPDLWVALCEVVLFWAKQGVRIFRVDNPHTKPLPFWEWLIAEVRAGYPDALFLAEAFTRPKVMNRLGKIGFSQSYTYFTWRNTARELREYMTELTTPPVADFFRPNFFVNTPDINPVFLQNSGRAGFLIRAALASTLSGLWGVYSGFELCEAAALPGREEYRDSEKYQIRAWDWDRPGNIVAEVTALNQIRRLNPALRGTTGLGFLPSTNDHVLVYEKATDDRTNVIVVAVSFDPFSPQYVALELPLWLWGLPDNAILLAEDLMTSATTRWHGKQQAATLTPETPFHVWRVRPA